MILNIKKSDKKFTNSGLRFENIEIVNGFEYKPNNNYITILSGYLPNTKQKTKYYIYSNGKMVIAVY